MLVLKTGLKTSVLPLLSGQKNLKSDVLKLQLVFRQLRRRQWPNGYTKQSGRITEEYQDKKTL